MALNLLKKRPDSSFYESFSDLIFCSLVTFVVLVLTLVSAIEDRVDGVKAEEQNVASERAQLLERKELVEEEIEKKEASIVGAQTRIDAMLGTRRFSGSSGHVKLSLMWDSKSSPTRIWPVPGALLSNYTSDTGDRNANIKRDKRIRRELQNIMRILRPLTPEELQSLLVAIPPFRVIDDAPRLGVLTADHADGLRVRGVEPNGPYAKSGGIVEDVIVAIEGAEISGDQSQKLAQLTSVIVKKEIGDQFALSVISAGKPVIRNPILERVAIEHNSHVNINFQRDFNLLTEGASDVDGKLAEGITASTLSRKAVDDLKLATEWNKRISTRLTQQYGHDESKERSAVLLVTIDGNGRTLRCGGVQFDIPSFRNLVSAFFGGGVVVEFVGADAGLPEWVTEEVLVPIGFVNKSPRLPPAGRRVVDVPPPE